jgi:hypothetical protein
VHGDGERHGFTGRWENVLRVHVAWGHAQVGEDPRGFVLELAQEHVDALALEVLDHVGEGVGARWVQEGDGTYTQLNFWS